MRGLGRAIRLDAPADAFGDPERVLLRAARHDDDEFLPAEPRADVEHPDAAAQDFAEIAQDDVSRQVPGESFTALKSSTSMSSSAIGI